MTGRIGLMMKLHDAQVADDVRRMAELGYFDTEFTMYGCAYMIQGKRYYRISPNAGDIYAFIEKSNLEDIFPSNVHQYTKKCAVPAGMKEVIAQEVKIELAKQLSTLFPVDFFAALNELAAAVTDDAAAGALWQEAEALEGVFDLEALRRFEKKMDDAYRWRRITRATFAGLAAWLKEERKSMLENFETKDVFEKTMYGFMYLDGDRPRYVENARLEYVYEKMYALEEAGAIVSPVFSKTFWYNYSYRLSDVVQDYKKELRACYDRQTLMELEQLRRATAQEGLLAETLALAQAQYGPAAAETLRRYGTRWGLYRQGATAEGD